jgi:hypothetical protein
MVEHLTCKERCVVHVELHRAGLPLPSAPLRLCAAAGSELYASRHQTTMAAGPTASSPPKPEAPPGARPRQPSLGACRRGRARLAGTIPPSQTGRQLSPSTFTGEEAIALAAACSVEMKSPDAPQHSSRPPVREATCAPRLAGEEVALVAGGWRGAALVGGGEGPGRDAPRHGAGGVKGGVGWEAAEARAPVRSGRCRRLPVPRGEVGGRQLPPETSIATPCAIVGYRQPPPPDTAAGLVRRPPPAHARGARRTSSPPGARRQARRGAAPACRPW